MPENPGTPPEHPELEWQQKQVVHRSTTDQHGVGLHSMQLCLKRQMILTMRNVVMIKSRIGQSVIGGFLLGSLYYQLALDDYNSGLGGASVSLSLGISQDQYSV